MGRLSLVLIGPSGCGKGTQGKKIEEVFGVPHLSAGDILRREVRMKTSIGRKVKAILDTGKLVDDDIISEIMGRRLSEDDCQKGYVLDGYPRTVGQAKALQRYLKDRGEEVTAVIAFDLLDDDIVRRLMGRLQCICCGRSYHEAFNPPPQDHRCERDGGELVKRDDDTEEVIRARICVYRQSTAPIIDFYENLGLLARMKTLGSIETVFEQIRSLIDEKRKNNAT